MLFILIVIVKKLWSITFQLCKIHKKAGKTNTVFAIKFMLILITKKEGAEKKWLSLIFSMCCCQAVWPSLLLSSSLRSWLLHMRKPVQMKSWSSPADVSEKRDLTWLKIPKRIRASKSSRAGVVFVIPFIQQDEFQTLDTFNVDVSVEDIMTIDASANALLRVG